MSHMRADDAREAADNLCSEPGCAWCGAKPIRANLDGEELCQACADAWARAEGQWQRQQEEEEHAEG